MRVTQCETDPKMKVTLKENEPVVSLESCSLCCWKNSTAANRNRCGRKSEFWKEEKFDLHYLEFEYPWNIHTEMIKRQLKI